MKDNKQDACSKTDRDVMIDALVEVKNRFGAPAARELIGTYGFADKINNIPSECYLDVLTACRAKLANITLPATATKPKTEIGDTTAPFGEMPKPVAGAFNHAQHDRVAHSGKEMSTFYIGLPGDLNTNTIKLVVDTANLMGQKLKAAQDKYGYEEGWMDREWSAEDVRKSAFEHLMKGDPLDVINYMAFMLYHGHSCAPQSMVEADEMVSALHHVPAQDKDDRRRSFNLRGRVIDSREKAKAAVAELQAAWDLVDEATNLRELMDRMEERHGDEFEAFLEATILQIMRGSGMTQVMIDTNEVAANFLTRERLVCREEQGKLIYELAENVEPAQPEADSDD